MNEQQKKQMAEEIEMAIDKLDNVSLFILRFGRTKRFFLCSDEFVEEAYTYLKSKGCINQPTKETK